MNRSGLPAGAPPKLLEPRFIVNHRILSRKDSEWPVTLNELGAASPERLFASGQPLDPDRMMIAIVGSRRPTAVGMEMAELFGRELARAGFTIVSGLATGIDAIAHKAALAAGGTTVAVVGCGLDVSYPHRNLSIRRLIDQRGTVLSEHPAGTPPRPHHFPERNRIVAGLSSAVLVVEGSERSGALITARLGLDFDRQVFAIPGSPWNAMSAAPNMLIRTSRAALVTEPDHVFEELAPQLAWSEQTGESTIPKIDPDDLVVLHVLTDQPLSTDRIARCAGLPSSKTALGLSRLSVRGFAQRTPIGYRITATGATALSGIENGGRHVDDAEMGEVVDP